MDSICSVVVLLALLKFYSYAAQDFHSGQLDSSLWVNNPSKDIIIDQNLKKGEHAHGAHPNSIIWVGEPRRRIILDEYVKDQALLKLLKEVEMNVPSIVKLIHVKYTETGNTSVLAVRIANNVDKERGFLKPKFKFVANIHGEDAVGTALMVSLIQYLGYSYGQNDRVTELLDSIDIWIVPVLNSYGFGKSTEYQGFTKNEKNVDMDTDFQDKFTLDKHPKRLVLSPRDATVLEMMFFITHRPFVLSGNLQGGSIVASYPYDNAKHPKKHGSLTPDNKVFVKLAKDYARRNSMMAPGDACNESFPGGITNGYQRMRKAGGMQDFNYHYSNCFELTFYLSCTKYPPAADLPYYWYANLDAMLGFMESTTMGVFGQVRDKNRNAIVGAVIKVKGNHKKIKTTNRGEYWRLLVPGIYDITACATSFFECVHHKVEVPENGNVRVDFELADFSHTVDDYGQSY